MLNKRHLTYRFHVLTLLNQQVLYNSVRTCSQGFTFDVTLVHTALCCV